MLQPTKRLPLYASFLTLGAFVTLFVLLASPSDPKNAIFLGYSLERILLALAILIPGIALLFLTLNLFRHPERSQHLWAGLTGRGKLGNAVFLFALILFILCWVLTFMPSYRLGGLAGYVERLSPIIGWLAVVGAVTSVIILFERNNSGVRATEADRLILKTTSVFGAVFILIALVVMITGLGIRYPADYWFGAGVPVLGLQIVFSLFVGALALLIEKRLPISDKKWLDVSIFIVIWLVAAWFWAQEPLVANYFMPDTADNVIYPYSDGATFDSGAQYALIGEGLFGGRYFERVLYSVFLTYLHMVFGQDFVLLMAAQAAIFAVFPAVIYLLGRELHSRALGVTAGVLLAVRGVTAIAAAKWIDTASPKMVLTDFPTAIGIAVFMLLLVKWFKEPSKLSRLSWAGAVFGLTLMVRSNVLTLMPILLVFIPWLLKINWRQFILTVLIILLGMLSVTLPWELRNRSLGIPMYSSYYSRIIIILQHRYGIGGDVSLLPREETVAFAARETSRQRVFVNQTDPACSSFLCAIPNHFLHNLVTSFVSLPSTLVFDDLWNIVKADTPYWKKTWDEGNVGVTGGVLLFINLLITALGIGSIWNRSKSLTLLPLLFLFAYLFTNSIGLTSGGRYVAPVDWIVHFFFIAGGLQLVIWFLRAAGFEVDNETTNAKLPRLPVLDGNAFYKVIPSLALLLAIGALLPISEAFFQPRYQVREQQDILVELEETGFLEQSGFSRDELVAFLSQPNAMIREGRSLYPRYYPSGEGEQDRSTYYRYLDYQRLVFTLIGPYSTAAEGIVIPGFALPFSFHAEDVVVLGCWNTTYYAPFIDAVVVFVTSGEGYVYNREPKAPLQCPLPIP